MIFSRFKWNKTQHLELDRPLRAYIYFRNSRLNLLTGFPETYSIDQFLGELEAFHLQTRVKSPRVYHFYYELGLYMSGLGHSITEETPLAVELEYKRKRILTVSAPRLSRINLKTLERPTWTEYKEAFNHIQNELLDGNCYQVNLTYPFDFETEDLLDPRDIADFMFSRKGLGAYAHASYLGDEMILSNSPECLFQYRDEQIISMPIKGTLKREGKLKDQWIKLLSNPKEESELLMITDLLKNDLNRLDKPKARVLKLRKPLLVPSLLHQYSLLSLKLDSEVSLYRTLECLFPGGSITGAPKKSVMEIITRTERFNRGIYCGSTLLCYEDKKVASINIRTASINTAERLWRYGAGGGITLLSRPVEEFLEMEAKVSSFLTLFETP